MIFSAVSAWSAELRRELHRLVQGLPPARVAVVMMVFVMEMAATGAAAAASRKCSHPENSGNGRLNTRFFCGDILDSGKTRQ
mmetsp:Transcript_61194/g.121165  ORF Transcript_61194/g.121165 Transcript_61194/m.121165 type:complete len:82 (-) Transcript_61194:15-260(-)